MADKKPAPKKQPETLAEQILAKQIDLIEAKRALAAGELQNPRVIKNLKKDIARLLTKLNSEKGKGAAGDDGSVGAPRDEGKPSVLPHKRSAKEEEK